MILTQTEIDILVSFSVVGGFLLGYFSKRCGAKQSDLLKQRLRAAESLIKEMHNSLEWATAFLEHGTYAGDHVAESLEKYQAWIQAKSKEKGDL